MTNYFELLSIPVAAIINSDLLDSNYKQAAAEAHPDQGGNEHQFNLILTAYQTLLRPSKRIKYLLDIHHIEYDKRGTVSNHLMNFFMSTGEILQRADTLIKKKQSSSSALIKALLENESLTTQEAISQQIDQLDTAHTEVINQLPETIDTETYPTAARDLSFIEKWQAQLKERFGQLF